ncbi:uncharacterized protein LOC123703930 [Colias croceus]|uniref:uncharacterized protein LOC123703930 n=1 Tax=Colias crocea TaxID=72248 RepID=UPI001E27AE5D|nr:uncharacterized protein LOC123703930 [Colias croceus]
MWNKKTWTFKHLTEFSKHFLSHSGLYTHNWFYNYKTNLSKRNFGLLKLATSLNKPRSIYVMLSIVKKYLAHMIEVTRICVIRSQGNEMQLKVLLDELPQPMWAVIDKLALVHIVDAMESTKLGFLPTYCSTTVTKIVSDIVKLARKNIAAKAMGVRGEGDKMANYVLSPMVVKEAADEMHVSIQTVFRVWKAAYLRTVKRLQAGEPLFLPEWQVADIAILYDPSICVVAKNYRMTCKMEDMMKLLHLLQKAIAKIPRPVGTVDVIFAIPDPVGSEDVLASRTIATLTLGSESLATGTLGSESLNTGALATGATGSLGTKYLESSETGILPTDPLGSESFMSKENIEGTATVDTDTNTNDLLEGTGQKVAGSEGNSTGSHLYREWLARVWTAVHFAYCSSGDLVSLPLLQRRWHEARTLARSSLTTPSDLNSLNSLSSLSRFVQLVAQMFPNAVLTKSPDWLELVQQDLVILTPLSTPDLGLLEDLENCHDIVPLEEIFNTLEINDDSMQYVQTEEDDFLLENENEPETLEKIQSIDPSNAKVSIIFESDSDEDKHESKSLETVVRENDNTNEYQPVAKKPRIDFEKDSRIDLKILDEREIVKSNVVIDNIISEGSSVLKKAPVKGSLCKTNLNDSDSDDNLMIDETINADSSQSEEKKDKLYVVPLDSILKNVCSKKNYDKSHRFKIKEEPSDAKLNVVKDFLKIIDSKGKGGTDVLLDNLNKMLNMKYKNLLGETSREDSVSNSEENVCQDDDNSNSSMDIDGSDCCDDESDAAGKLDPALTMDTKVLLCRCDEIPTWQRHSKNGSIKLKQYTVSNLMKYNKPVRKNKQANSGINNERDISARKDNKMAAIVKNLEKEQNIFLDMFTRPMNDLEIKERQKIIQLKLSQTNPSPDATKSNRMLSELLSKPLFLPKTKNLSKHRARNIPIDGQIIKIEDDESTIDLTRNINEDTVPVMSSIDKQTMELAKICDLSRFTELSNAHTIVKDIQKELHLLSLISNKLKNMSQITNEKNKEQNTSNPTIDITKIQSQINILSAMSRKLNMTQENISKIKEEINIFTQLSNADNGEENSSKEQDTEITENMDVVETTSQNDQTNITDTFEDNVDSINAQNSPENYIALPNTLEVKKEPDFIDTASTSKDIPNESSSVQEKPNAPKSHSSVQEKPNAPKENKANDKAVVISNILKEILQTVDEQCKKSDKVLSAKLVTAKQNLLAKSSKTTSTMKNIDKESTPNIYEPSKGDSLRNLLLKPSKIPKSKESNKSTALANVLKEISDTVDKQSPNKNEAPISTFYLIPRDTSNNNEKADSQSNVVTVHHLPFELKDKEQTEYNNDIDKTKYDKSVAISNILKEITDTIDKQSKPKDASEGSMQECLLTKIFNKSTDDLLENVYKHGVTKTLIKKEPNVKIEPNELETKIKTEDNLCETTNIFDSAFEVSDEFSDTKDLQIDEDMNDNEDLPPKLIKMLKKHGLNEMPVSFWKNENNIYLAKWCKPFSVKVRKMARRQVKKVELPNIEEVRKINKTMLIAQVAPTVTHTSIKPQPSLADNNFDVRNTVPIGQPIVKSKQTDLMSYKSYFKDLYSDVLPLLAFSAKKILKSQKLINRRNQDMKKQDQTDKTDTPIADDLQESSQTSLNNQKLIRRRRRKKKNQTDIYDKVDTPMADDLQEWERQKNKVRQYFELPNYKKNIEVINVEKDEKTNESEQTVIVLDSDDEIPSASDTFGDRQKDVRVNVNVKYKNIDDDNRYITKNKRKKITHETRILDIDDVNKEIQSEIENVLTVKRSKEQTDPMLAMDVTSKSSRYISTPRAFIPVRMYLSSTPHKMAPLFKVDASKQLWILDAQYLILTTKELPFQSPSYWTSVSGPNFKRFTQLLFEDIDEKIDKDKDSDVGKDAVVDLTSDGEEMDAISGNIKWGKMKTRKIYYNRMLRDYGLNGVVVYSVIQEMSVFQKVMITRNRLLIYSLKTGAFAQLRQLVDKNHISQKAPESSSKDPVEYVDITDSEPQISEINQTPSQSKNISISVPSVVPFHELPESQNSMRPFNSTPTTLPTNPVFNQPILPSDKTSKKLYISVSNASSSNPTYTLCESDILLSQDDTTSDFPSFTFSITPDVTLSKNIPKPNTVSNNNPSVIVSPSSSINHNNPASIIKTNNSVIVKPSTSKNVSSNITPQNIHISSPNVTPENIPISAPNVAPENIPISAPNVTPENISISAPNVTPENISISAPNVTPENISISAPNVTPENISISAPNVTPENISISAPNVTPENISISAPNVTPENISISAPNVTPENIPISAPNTVPNNTISVIVKASTSRVPIPIPTKVENPENQIIPTSDTNVRPNLPTWMIQSQATGKALSLLLTPIIVSNKDKIQNTQSEEINSDETDSIENKFQIKAEPEMVGSNETTSNETLYMPPLLIGPQITDNKSNKNSVNNNIKAETENDQNEPPEENSEHKFHELEINNDNSTVENENSLENISESDPLDISESEGKDIKSEESTQTSEELNLPV